jgi:hypothetical protein
MTRKEGRRVDKKEERKKVAIQQTPRERHRINAASQITTH